MSQDRQSNHSFIKPIQILFLALPWAHKVKKIKVQFRKELELTNVFRGVSQACCKSAAKALAIVT